MLTQQPGPWPDPLVSSTAGLPPCHLPRAQPRFGPQLTFIGLDTPDPSNHPNLDWWVELLGDAEPANLYQGFRATVAARLA